MSRDKIKEIKIVLPFKIEYSDEEKYKIWGGLFILFGILLIPSLIWTLPSFAFISYIFGLETSDTFIFIILLSISLFLIGLSCFYYSYKLSSRKLS